MTTVTPPLTSIGVSVLLVYGAKIFPPKAATPGSPGKPGIRVTVDLDGSCLLTPVGYSCATTAGEALFRAENTCIEAGLEVAPVDRWTTRVQR